MLLRGGKTFSVGMTNDAASNDKVITMHNVSGTEQP